MEGAGLSPRPPNVIGSRSGRLAEQDRLNFVAVADEVILPLIPPLAPQLESRVVETRDSETAKPLPDAVDNFNFVSRLDREMLPVEIGDLVAIVASVKRWLPQ